MCTGGPLGIRDESRFLCRTKIEPGGIKPFLEPFFIRSFGNGFQTDRAIPTIHFVIEERLYIC